MSAESGRALVTGAAGGIGRAVVEKLIGRGVTVTAVDIDEDGMREAFGGDADILAADLGDIAQREAVCEAGSGCDYLVNAAGILRLTPITEVTVDEWREVMRINAEATFFLCQKIGRTMPAGGAIVNLSSASAKLATTTESAVYAASKTAILSVTRSFAYALAHIPVRVNAVCPGIIDTSMQEQILERVAPMRGVTADELQRVRHAAIPLGRTGAPEELAGYIWFLLSSDAGYITGQALNYGGGLVTY